MAKRTRPTRPTAPRNSPAAVESGDGLGPSVRLGGAVLGWLLLVLVLWTACRPISRNTLWWDLARGRRVLAGSWTPSRDLLALDQAAEADWLGGVPGYLLYASLGAHGLMAGRLVCAAALLGWLLSRFPWRRTAHRLPVAAAWLGLLASSLDPGPPLWDLLAVVAACCWLGRADPARATPVTAARLGWLALLVVLAVSTAPRAVVALGVVVLGAWAPPFTRLLPNSLAGKPPEAQQSGKVAWRRLSGILAVVLAASCASPRGWAGLWDSTRLTFPWLASPTWALADTPWQPLLASWRQDPGSPTVWIFALSSLLLVFFAGRVGFPVRFLLAWVLAQTLAWTSAANMPVAAVILAGFADELFRSPRVASVPADAAAQATGAAPVWDTVWASSLTGFALLFWSVPFSEMGWGVDQRLDPRFLQMAISEVKFNGSAWCDDARGAGMLSWLAPAGMQPQDVPQRALLQGRWAEHCLLAQDLRADRRHRYWRDDASAGGWWLALQQHHTQLLLVNAEDDAMIAGLEPTLWKPLMLDSPVLAFGKAGDPALSNQLIVILGQRALVNQGGWSYSPPQSTSSVYDRDLWGLASDLGTPALALRQARVFAAMQLNIAAMRVLLYAVARWPEQPSLRTELARQQRALAQDEWLLTWRLSDFRAAALRASLAKAPRTLVVSSPLRAAMEEASSGDWRQIAELYVDGRALDALAVLKANGSAPRDVQEEARSLYAQARLELELSDPEAAQITARRVIALAADQPLGRLAAGLLDLWQKE